MSPGRRISIPAAAALTIALGLPLQASADAVFDPNAPQPTFAEPFDPTLVIAIGVLAGIVALILAATFRPAWRRWIAAGVTGLLVTGFGLLVAVVGLFFADWSGNHAVSWPLVAIGSVVAVAGIIAAVRVLMGGSERTPS